MVVIRADVSANEKAAVKREKVTKPEKYFGEGYMISNDPKCP
jgi:hypothetical protein